VSWHTLPPEQTLALLESQAEGLTTTEADRRLQHFGPNRLERVEPISAWRILVAQFASLVVVLLAVAAGVAFALGDVLEAMAIAGVLAINTSIGFAVELRARRAMDALLRYEVPTATVLRDGRPQRLPSDRLVPGDVITLEEGDAVPADARLIGAVELRTVEASLTGESLPVDKAPEALRDAGALLGDRAPMLYTGTEVVTGRADAVVVHTGDETEIGRIGALITKVEAGKTPLEVHLDALGRRLVALTLGVAGFVTLLGVLRGAPVGLMIETGIALAIAAVPEGLPVVATIALAVGLRRMARRQALVRRLVAVEALGAVTVVCTDKTGTLTAGEMTAVRVVTATRALDVTGRGYDVDGAFEEEGRAVDPADVPDLNDLLEAAALTSRATLDAQGGAPIGDPTDAALSVLAGKGGVSLSELRARLPEVEEIPFSSERRSSATVHEGEDGRQMMVKGAPSVLLDRSRLSADGRAAFDARNAEMAAAGLRVIGLASGPASAQDGLTMLGLVGILDPPAEGVQETIATLRSAGIRTVMITGDQQATAEAVARMLHSTRDGDSSMGGRELAACSDSDLADRIDRVGVFSRVSPEDKVRIVSALQHRGEVVAMIGDGVNDAAALKKADVGVAMGLRGTDVAKQTASIVLTDDRFRTISAAVEEGRVVYDNIRKFVFYLFSCNVAEVMVLLGAAVVGLPVPLLPLQILWLNLVTDTFPALALAMEPAEPEVMARPPRRPDQSILSRAFVRSIGFYAALITVVTLVAYTWAMQTGGPDRAITMAFMTLALAQLFHLGNARSRGPVLRPARIVANPWALASVPLVLGLQLAAVYLEPLARLLGTVPLSLSDWAVVGGLSILPGLIGQLIEVAQGRRAAVADGSR